MKSYWLGLKFTFAYFSILPVKFKKSDDLSAKPVLGAMLLFFPLVGLILGSLTVALFVLLEPLGWYGALIAAVFYMMLYGFLHTEAVMDVADALYASHSKKDAYRIIKEPTVGAMGVLWVIALVLLKLSGIVFLLLHHLFLPFISVLLISRLLLLVLFRVEEFKSSFATQLKAALRPNHLIASFALFSLLGIRLISFEFMGLLLLGVGLGITVARSLKSKLGFINGDVLGATLESVEILLFLLVALLWL